VPVLRGSGHLTLFGDRADTLDTPAAMTGEDADGRPLPIPLFGLTYRSSRHSVGGVYCFVMATVARATYQSEQVVPLDAW
jgi:hypothetical protein